MKRFLSILLTLVLLCSASLALANTAEPWDFPLAEEPINITAMGLQSPQGGDHNEMLSWQVYEDMTGIDIEWENVPTATQAERFSVVMASNDLPDMFWAMDINTANLVRYGSLGVFAPIEEYIEKYAYNFQKILDEYPSVRGAITMADGHIYGLPNMIMGDNMRTNKMFMNPDWLKAVGKEMPANMEELVDVLRAFRDEDANENGDPNDEIPLIIRYNDAHFLPALYNFFGLGNRGTGHRYVDWDYENDTLRFGDMNPSELWFGQSGYNLTIGVIGSGDKVTVTNWFYSADYKIDSIEAGGLAIAENQVALMIQAMAAIGAPGAADGGWTQEQQEALAPVLASCWRERV